MGTNNLATKNDGDIIKSDDPNQFKTAFDLDLVPRNTSGAPEDIQGGLGTSLFRWLNAFVKKITVGDSNNLVTIEESASALLFKFLGTIGGRITVDGIDGTTIEDETIPFSAFDSNALSSIIASFYSYWFTATAAQDGTWTGVVFGNDVFVAVNLSATNNQVMRSINWGTSWTAIDSATPTGGQHQYRGVAFGNSFFIALGGNVGGDNHIMRSSDNGVTWATGTVPESNNWLSIAFGNGVFVAVAASGTNRAMRSTDNGFSWTAIAAAAANSWASVTYGDGVFIAVSTDGTNRTMRSTDLGLTWTPVAAAAANQWFGIAYGGGVFVAVASDGTNRVMRSTDLGLTWTPVAAAAANQWSSIAFGNGVFIAASFDGTHQIMHSYDLGLTWTPIVTPQADVWRAVAYGGGVMVIVGNSSTNHKTMRSLAAVERV